jgi:hypothetical protein
MHSVQGDPDRAAKAAVRVAVALGLIVSMLMAAILLARQDIYYLELGIHQRAGSCRLATCENASRLSPP